MFLMLELPTVQPLASCHMSGAPNTSKLSLGQGGHSCPIPPPYLQVY